MAEAELPASTPRIVDYSSNSKKTKSSPTEARPELEKVISGTAVVRKKSVGAKFREQFAGDDAQTVGQYLLFDVVLPASKNLIFDMLTEGAKRLLFGGSRPSGGLFSGSGVGGRTNYKAYSGSGVITQTSSPSVRELTPQQRAMNDFSGVVLGSKEEAYRVLEVLTDLIEQYGVASVNDFNACVGLTSDFTQQKYGWTNLNTAGVRAVREGYLLEMPKAIVLE